MNNDMTPKGDLADYLTYTDLRGLSPATYRLRRQVLRVLLRITGRDNLLEVTQGDLEDWERVAVAGRMPETRRTYVSTVTGYYQWALRREHLTVDPSTRLTLPKVPQGLPRPISEPDLELALAAALATNIPMHAMLRLMCDAGLRAMEVAAIAREDLRDGSVPMILLVREAKGGKQRLVPVGQSVRLAILRLHVRRGPLFPAATLSGHITATWVSQAVNHHLHGLGIPDTGHSLRHRWMTVGYQHTRDIRLMQTLGGHSSPATTARYTAFAPSNAADLVAHLDALAAA